MKAIDKEKSVGWRQAKSGEKANPKAGMHDGPEGSAIFDSTFQGRNIIALSEIKTAKQKKLKEQRILFSSIGLCLSLVLTIGAFEWKNYADSSVVAISKDATEFEDLMEIPQTEQPPPPPPQVQEAAIVEVEDEEIIEEIEINLDIEMTEETEIEDVVFDDFNDVPEEKPDEIFSIVEEQPSPQGGMTAFYEFVGNNMKYPSKAERLNIEGRVFVQFVVEKDGSLTDIQVVRGIGAGCDEEAVRVLSIAPKWNPGKQRGRPVRVRMILPIVFKLVK